jgi:hypothetical protein
VKELGIVNEKEKAVLLDQLYEVLQQTENEAAYEVIGDAISFIKKQ